MNLKFLASMNEEKGRCIMSAQAGRPQKVRDPKQIRFNIDADMADSIKQMAKEEGMPQADIIRDAIKSVSSKEYDEMVPHVSLERLQRLSNECWKTLHTKGVLFEIDKLSQNMPAFVTTVTTLNPQVQVKYPTFKLEIYKPDESTDPNKLDEELQGIPGHSPVCIDMKDYIISNGKIRLAEKPFIMTVTCLAIGLDNNKKIADQLKERLTELGYSYNIYPSYCLRGADIELTDDKKYFKVIDTDS